MREASSYPQSPFITLFDNNRTFRYEIIKEGTYPPHEQCYYTKNNPRYRIPNDYIVKTRHGKEKHLAKCSIQYKDRRPVYTVCFGLNFALQVQSSKSATDAACQYYEVVSFKQLL